jgi:hypothetical protein
VVSTEYCLIQVPNCPVPSTEMSRSVPSTEMSKSVPKCPGTEMSRIQKDARPCLCMCMDELYWKKWKKGSAKPYRSTYFYSSIKWKKCIFHNQMFTYIHVVVFVFVLPEVIKLLKCYFQSVISVQQSFYFLKIKTIVLSFPNKLYIYSLIHIIIPATIYFLKLS